MPSAATSPGCHRPPPSRRAALSGLATVMMVEAEVERDGKTSTARRYYLSSAIARCRHLRPRGARSRGIENRLHWVLDVVFHDDLARLRTGHGPENMATVKHMAINLVRQAMPTTVSRTAASWPPGTPTTWKPCSARPREPLQAIALGANHALEGHRPRHVHLNHETSSRRSRRSRRGPTTSTPTDILQQIRAYLVMTPSVRRTQTSTLAARRARSRPPPTRARRRPPPHRASGRSGRPRGQGSITAKRGGEGWSTGPRPKPRPAEVWSSRTASMRSSLASSRRIQARVWSLPSVMAGAYSIPCAEAIRAPRCRWHHRPSRVIASGRGVTHCPQAPPSESARYPRCTRRKTPR